MHINKNRIHDKRVEAALRQPGVKREYEALEEEFTLLSEMLKARQQAGKTQKDVATTMHTTTSVVGRLETGWGKNYHSPTLATLKKYAHALDCKLSIKFIRQKH